MPPLINISNTTNFDTWRTEYNLSANLSNSVIPSHNTVSVNTVTSNAVMSNAYFNATGTRKLVIYNSANTQIFP